MRHDPYSFDVTMAVEARRWYAEPHTWQEIQAEVWQPTIALLKDLAKAQPASLLCANSLAYEQSLGITIPRADIDIVLDNGKTLLYLGMVLARQPAEEIWKRRWQRAATPEQRAWLARCGPQAVVRSSIDCVIPVLAEALSDAVCTEALAKFWQSVDIPLQDVPVTWLPETVTLPLYERIADTVRSQVTEYTAEDIDRMIELEEF